MLLPKLTEIKKEIFQRRFFLILRTFFRRTREKIFPLPLRTNLPTLNGFPTK
jgi:hypothetical protein